jgi:hypothetical protein
MRSRLRPTAIALGATFALLALYAVTIPSNQTETEDSFAYAYKVRSGGYADLIFPHHLAYLPVAKAIYSLGIFADPFRMMLGANVLLGSAGVLLAYAVARRSFALSTRAAAFAALFLAFSYGYWRYSVAAEVYVPAVFMQALLCLAAFSGRTGPAHAVLCGLLASAAVVTHGPLSAPLAVAAVPVYFALGRRLRTLAIYGAVAALAVGATYYTGWRLHAPGEATLGQFVDFIKGPPEEFRSFSAATLVKAVLAFGTVVIATNILFAVPPIVERVHALMPYRNLTEELFTAKTFSPSLAGLALVLAVLLALAALYIAMRLRLSRGTLASLAREPKIGALLVWVVTYALLVIVIHPDSPELWICFLLPLALGGAVLLQYGYKAPTMRVPFAFCGLLFAYNFCGMAMIRSEASDFNAHKAAWVLREVRSGDHIYPRDADVFTRYVRYQAAPGVAVVNCWARDASATEELLKTAASARGRAFVFNDVFEPPPYLAPQIAGGSEGLRVLRSQLAERLRPTADPQVFLLEPPPAQP